MSKTLEELQELLKNYKPQLDHTKFVCGFHTEFYPKEFGIYVYTGPIAGGSNIYRFGSVVQVRKKSGAFGSDQILLRHADGSLQVHENQSFWKILNEEDVAFYDQLFTEKDEPNTEYTIGDSQPEKGFIIPDRGIRSDATCTMSITVTNEQGAVNSEGTNV